MSKKALKLDNIEVIKNEFHASKHPIASDLVNINQILISDIFEHSDKNFKYFIGYKEDDIVKPVCIILLQISGFIKYFDNGKKIIAFMIEDDIISVKYIEIWNKVIL